jgi:hypothetical protein
MVCDFGQARGQVKATDKSGAEDDARENFADDFGLPKSHEKIAEQVSQPYQKQQKEEDGSEI